ncbi:MAG: hypothetical protein Q9167_005743 [Letrouitia subvulpina]
MPVVWNWPFCSTSPLQIYAGGVGSGSEDDKALEVLELVISEVVLEVLELVDVEVVLGVLELVDAEVVLEVLKLVDLVVLEVLELVDAEVVLEVLDIVDVEVVLRVLELVDVEVVLEVFEDEEEVVVIRHEQPDDTRDAGYCDTYVGKGWFGGGRAFGDSSIRLSKPLTRPEQTLNPNPMSQSALKAPRKVETDAMDSLLVVQNFDQDEFEYCTNHNLICVTEASSTSRTPS